MRSAFVLLGLRCVGGCSNILVTRGASAEGRAHVSYNADEASLFGAVSHWPRRGAEAGAVRDVFSWDSGALLGRIPDENATLNVMANANEFGVVIGETTHGGLAMLSNTGKNASQGHIIDYGSLIWLTLQRARSAREAIDVMVELCEAYGYASDLEGFSITDGDEVWYMELTGRGDFDAHGVLYVALKIPDGYVSAHANQARITHFLPCDASDCKASPDLVDFAVSHDLYPADADPLKFSFSDAVDPLTFSGARFCEARVWDIFRQVCDPADFDADKFVPYARGYDLKAKRMPLWCRPARKLDRQTIHNLMSSHFTGSFFDPALDVGAGDEHTPYRWNGLEWSLGNLSYVNERLVGTQYTGWHFVATVAPRGVLPEPMRALLWFGADDHAQSPKIPLHGGATKVHSSYDDSDCTGRKQCRLDRGLPGTVTDFSLESAWWLNNVVADNVYTRYDRAAPVVRDARAKLDALLVESLKGAEAEAAALFASGDAARAVSVLDAHAVSAGALATQTWLALWQQLMVLFIDGRVTVPDSDELTCGCSKVTATLSDAFLTKVVSDTGDKYRAKDNAQTDDDGRPKMSLRQKREPAPAVHKAKAKRDVRGVF
ncbi:peptidase family C69-domain-containing protein [Pelagophyceae sp. CCMP2097]|nr:peptidase family C69-domain-containing protein [Pelagophyceae sp. CCMP2097]|mmetsp:Transcript_16820/g.56838  ORF Transcript_16820/g.56838 Transcript_16820/m.56838 type:complete len:604 (-) Transcript_16820:81-1892(-)